MISTTKKKKTQTNQKRKKNKQKKPSKNRLAKKIKIIQRDSLKCILSRSCFWSSHKFEHYETPVIQWELLPQGIKLCTHVWSWIPDTGSAAFNHAHWQRRRQAVERAANLDKKWAGKKELVDSQTASNSLFFFKLKISFHQTHIFAYLYSWQMYKSLTHFPTINSDFISTKGVTTV